MARKRKVVQAPVPEPVKEPEGYTERIVFGAVVIYGIYLGVFVGLMMIFHGGS